jgi:hypothetical protein
MCGRSTQERETASNSKRQAVKYGWQTEKKKGNARF